MDEQRRELNMLWRIRLFDGPVVEDGSGSGFRRFRSRKVGALLAYLALHLGRPCPREELFEALWPDDDIVLSANRLRVTLASLRKQLEPDGVPFGAVLDVSVPGQVRLRDETTCCDVDSFERAWKAGRRDEAARIARGTLLPGYYEEWILDARERYEAILDAVSVDGSGHNSAAGDAPAVPVPRSPRPGGSVNTPVSRLPLYLTRFFGRQSEQQKLRDLIAAHRLVTVAGTGGMGKTRLAVETARNLELPTICVSLAELPDTNRLVDTLLQALGVLPQASADSESQLLSVLPGRGPLLLILDNAEHLVEALAGLATRLLQCAPDLRMLVTTRQRLDVPGEVVLQLKPLEPPPYSALPERLMEFPSIALFVDRARAARPDFTTTPRHVEALVNICLRLEGMPLALELAAARISVQSPAQIAASLAESLVELKSRQRGLSERHRSLRAAMQGSVNLLSEELKACFAALSVFQGGWTAEAAREVTGNAQAEEMLEELVLRSLVTVREDERGAIRYSLLETIRQFAAEQLSEQERETTADRHARYYLRLAAPAWEDNIKLSEPLDAEQQNLLLAIERGRKRRDDIFWNGLVGATMHAFVRGQHRMALGWVEDALGLISSVEDETLRFRVRIVACLVFADIGRLAEMDDIAHSILADARESGDMVRATYAQTYIGYVANESGRMTQAVQIQRAALEDARALDNTPLVYRCAAMTGRALLGFAFSVELGSPAADEALSEAIMLFRETIEISPPTSRMHPLAQLGLAIGLLYLRREQESYPRLKEAQAAAYDHRNLALLMYGFFYESTVARDQGEADRAAVLFGAFHDLRERIGYSVGRAAGLVDQFGKEIREAVGSERYESLVRQGRQMPHEELIALRLGITHRVTPSAPSRAHTSVSRT